MSADAMGYPLGMSMNDPYASIIDAKRIGAYLRDNRFEPLANRSAASHYFNSTGRIDRNLHTVRGSPPALFNIDSEPHANRFANGPALLHLALQRVPADGVESLVEQFRVVARIVYDFIAAHHKGTAEGYLRSRDKIAAPHLKWREIELGCQCIHHPLADKGAFVDSRRAIGRGGCLVGKPDMTDDLVGR